jgi:predicted nucleic acid-binding protein
MIVDELFECNPIVLGYKERAYAENIWIPSVVFGEKMQGWLKEIHENNSKSEKKVANALALMIQYDEFMMPYPILPYTDEAIARYRAHRPKHGLNDGRIAACAMAHDFTVATANVRHFVGLLPDDRIIDWTIDPNWEANSVEQT